MATPHLQAVIQKLASEFAERIVAAVRGASLKEILSETAGRTVTKRSGRSLAASGAGRGRPRRNGGETVLAAIASALRGTRGGLRAEELRASLGIDKAAFVSAIRVGLESGAVRKTGEKRGPQYFAR